MSDFEVILRKVDSIQNCMQRIVEKTQDNSDWVRNMDAADIVVLNLIRAIQLCVNMAGCLITQKKWGLPKSLGDSFAILRKNNVIGDDLMTKMHKMIGFHNVATHAYREINYDILKSIIKNHLTDFEEYYTIILSYTDKLEKST